MHVNNNRIKEQLNTCICTLYLQESKQSQDVVDCQGVRKVKSGVDICIKILPAVFRIVKIHFLYHAEESISEDS